MSSTIDKSVFDENHVFRKDGIYAVPENMTWPECYIKTTTAKPREQHLMNKFLKYLHINRMKELDRLCYEFFEQTKNTFHSFSDCGCSHEVNAGS